MGVYVNLANEVYNRIYTAREALDIQHLDFGMGTQILQIDDYQSVVIELDIQELGERARNNQKSGDVSFTIYTRYGLSDTDENNLYFNIDTETGWLYWMEKFLDVLEKNTAGQIDPQMAGYARESIKIRVENPEKYQDSLITPVIVTAPAPYFTIGNRQGA